MKRRYIFLMSFLLLFNFVSCFSQDAEISDKPEDELVSFLNQGKILMLADFGHHTAESYYSLLRILDRFYNTEKPQRLTLVVEYDSIYANKVNEFMHHRSTDSLFQACYSWGNLEDIEFLEVLANLIEWNKKTKKTNSTITIKGFEQVINEDHYKRTIREGELWFINERDSITASGIINYVNDHPDEKILIFYGGAHLLDSLQNKAYLTISGEQSKGFYLAHYLREEFGKEKVVTVNQVIVDSTIYLKPILAKYNADVLLKTGSLPSEDFFQGNYDYTILKRNLFFTPTHRLSMIFSRKGIEQAIISLNEFEIQLSGNTDTPHKSEYDAILDGIYMVTGLKFKDSGSLKKWYSKNSYNGMERLTTNEFRHFLFDYVYDDPGDYSLMKKLNLRSLGFGPGIMGPLMLKEIWKANEDRLFEIVMFHNSISVYWLGYPDEKKEAKKILSKHGLDFEHAIEYLKWFRRNYYSRDY